VPSVLGFVFKPALMCFEFCFGEKQLEYGSAGTDRVIDSSSFQFSRQELLCFDKLFLCSLERAIRFAVRGEGGTHRHDLFKRH
jgi:hypothetical protein